MDTIVNKYPYLLNAVGIIVIPALLIYYRP